MFVVQFFLFRTIFAIMITLNSILTPICLCIMMTILSLLSLIASFSQKIFNNCQKQFASILSQFLFLILSVTNLATESKATNSKGEWFLVVSIVISVLICMLVHLETIGLFFGVLKKFVRLVKKIHSKLERKRH